MIAWTRKHTWAAGLLILILTNVVTLGGVAYNRAGEPDALLQLTERELKLPYAARDDRENSGIELAIEWRTLQVVKGGYGGYTSRWAAVEWLDEARLTELGFEAGGATASGEARLRLNHSLPREVWLVLEYDGPAYQAMRARVQAFLQAQQALAHRNPGDEALEERATRAQKLWETEQLGASRLFVVDAGLAPARLRERYPDRARYAVVRGRVRALVNEISDDTWHVQGYIEGLSVTSVNVPLEFRDVFSESPGGRSRKSGNKPGYTVTLAYGRRHEPWVVSAERDR